MVPRRLTLVTDTVIQPTPDSTAPNWLRSSSRMVVGRDFLAIFSAGNLKVFDHSGKHLWSTSRYEFSPGQAQSAKRPGAGSSVNAGDWLEWVVDGSSYAPGALLSATSIHLSGDSIVVLQPGGSVNIYNRTGRVLALKRLRPTQAMDRYYGGETALMPSASGWLLLTNASSPPGVGATSSVGRFHLLRASLVNGETGPPLREWSWENPSVRQGGGPGQFFNARPLIPVSPVAAMANGTLYYSRGSELAIELYDEYGRLKRVVEVETQRVPVTAELLALLSDNAARTYRTRMANGDSIAAMWLREVLPAIQKMPSPKFRPAVGAMWIGTDGSIAIRRNDLDPRPTETGDSLIVDVIGRDGRYRGRAAFAQPEQTIVHFTGSEFYVAESAGTLRYTVDRRNAQRVTATQAGANALEMQVIYQRLLRMRIAD
jgi:hypothetical protein